MKTRCIALFLAVLITMGCVCPALAQGQYAPRVRFHIPDYVGHLGREISVVVQCDTPQMIVKGNNVFELRNHRGVVLDRRTWYNPNDYLTFRFMVTEQLLGANELSVWWNDRCVGQDRGFGAFADPNVRRITQLQPEVPAIALTIVCGGGGDKQVEAILAVLRKYQVTCTFFIAGLWLEKKCGSCPPDPAEWA